MKKPRSEKYRFDTANSNTTKLHCNSNIQSNMDAAHVYGLIVAVLVARACVWTNCSRVGFYSIGGFIKSECTSLGLMKNHKLEFSSNP